MSEAGQVTVNKEFFKDGLTEYSFIATALDSF